MNWDVNMQNVMQNPITLVSAQKFEEILYKWHTLNWSHLPFGYGLLSLTWWNRSRSKSGNSIGFISVTGSDIQCSSTWKVQLFHQFCITIIWALNQSVESVTKCSYSSWVWSIWKILEDKTSTIAIASLHASPLQNCGCRTRKLEDNFEPEKKSR